jgi:release factor glutamine methyltransferase
MSITWRQLGGQLAADLAASGLDSPETDARRIVEAASGRDGAEYHRVLDGPASERGVAALDRMAVRRCAGEPLQYVIGRWGFRSLDLFVDARVLIPRPETEIVAGCALEELDRRGPGRRTVVDLGTGSGAIALSIAVERPQTDVWATDRSPDALDVARANLAGTGQASARVTLAQGSWFDALPDHLMGAVDVVVSNPPYIAAAEDLPAVVVDWEPEGALIAGPDGLEAVTAVLTGAARWLAPGGSVVVELAPHQTERAVTVADQAGLVGLSVRPDLAGRDRVVIARRPS